MSLIRSSLEAVLLVLSYEQLRLIPYKDAAGLATVGWGHLIKDGEKDRFTTAISRETANNLFLADFSFHELAVVSAIGEGRIDTLSPSQIGACTSLCFNIGPNAFKSSSVAKNIRIGELDKVPDSIKMWNKATVNGRKVVLPGLAIRRESEVRLWLGRESGGES